MIPKKLHFIYFKGRPFKFVYYLAIKSFKLYNPSYEVFLHYDSIDENIWFEKIKSICTLSQTEAVGYTNGQIIGTKQHQCDYVRLKKLYEHGGIYMDLDILTLKNIDPIIEEFETTGKPTLICQERATHTNFCNAFIATIPKSPFIEKWIHIYDTTWGEWDKYGYSYWMGHSTEAPRRIYDEHPEWLHVFPNHYFYPLYWEHIKKFLWDEEVQPLETSYGVHLWETEAEKMGLLPKDISFFYTHSHSNLVRLYKHIIVDDFPHFDKDKELHDTIKSLTKEELCRLKEIVNIAYTHVDKSEKGFYPIKFPTKQLPDTHIYRRLLYYIKECNKNDYYVGAYYDNYLLANLKGNMMEYKDNRQEQIYNNLKYPIDRILYNQTKLTFDTRPKYFWNDELLKYLYTKCMNDFILLSDTDTLNNRLTTDLRSLSIQLVLLLHDWDAIFFKTDDGPFRIVCNGHYTPSEFDHTIVYHRTLFRLYETDNSLNNIYWFSYTVFNYEKFIPTETFLHYDERDVKVLEELKSPFCYLQLSADSKLLNTYKKDVYLGVPDSCIHELKSMSYVTTDKVCPELKGKKVVKIEDESQLENLDDSVEVLMFKGSGLSELCLEVFENTKKYCVNIR